MQKNKLHPDPRSDVPPISPANEAINVPASLRIVHVVKHCQHGNGNANVAVDLACAQATAGANVSFICHGGSFVGLLKDCGVTVVDIPHGHNSVTGNVAATWKLRAYFKEFQPDVIHAHMAASTVLASLAARGLNVPVVATVHNSFDWQSALMRAAHRVVAVSMAEYGALVQRGFRNDKLSAVINGTEGSLREPFLATDPPVSLKKPCVVTACGLHGRKGADIVMAGFIEAARHRPDWNFYLLGDGIQRANLERQARESGIGDRIHVLGFRNQPRAILDQADIFVIGSYAEPCCLVLSEARNAGCAAIATAVGGNSELLEHGRAGRLVPPGNSAAFARELASLMESPDRLAAAKAASREGNAFFNLDRVRQDYEAVYRTSMSRDVHGKRPVLRAKGPDPSPVEPVAVPASVAQFR